MRPGLSHFSRSSTSVYYTERKPKNKKRGSPGNEATHSHLHTLTYSHPHILTRSHAHQVQHAVLGSLKVVAARQLGGQHLYKDTQCAPDICRKRRLVLVYHLIWRKTVLLLLVESLTAHAPSNQRLCSSVFLSNPLVNY